MADIIIKNPALLLLQFIRGLIWAGLAFLVVQMSGGDWRLTALFIGLLFGIMASGGLLLPNPYMPAEVRWVHFWETTTSNLLFGLISGWMLRERPPAGGDA